MKLKRASTVRAALAMAIAAVGIYSGMAMSDETLRAGDPISMDKWYGRAGGLVGSDRVMAIGKSSANRVGITYDVDVAKRTNMQSDTGRITSRSSEIEQRRHPLAEELELLDRISDGPQEQPLDPGLGVAGETLRARLRRRDQQPFAELLDGPPERGRHPLL